MHRTHGTSICWAALLVFVTALVLGGDSCAAEEDRSYGVYVEECAALLMEYGTDRYGEVHAPILVSILDVASRDCPRDPTALDEPWRVTRRERRNPAGANLLTDQPLLKTLRMLSAATGDERYAAFCRRYAGYYMEHLVDEKGFFWWGWHRHYDVYRDAKDGHAGNHHEIHAIHSIDWEMLWEVNAEAVRREIEAVWRWHVIDKETGEINRHGDGQRGCDFSMSAGACIEAFAFLHAKTDETTWLERARLLAGYYWARRNPDTDLFPERPNAGKDRFDGSSFVTSITGPYCHALLKAYELTGEAVFRDQAVAYLRAYARYGFVEKTGRFRGALALDGTGIAGPRMASGYAQYEPRGELDLWEPYVAGYQFPIYTAQAYVHAYQLTKEAVLLETARRFAAWISATPPGSAESENTWYEGYSTGPGRQGTYAGKYGRAISFLLHLYVVTGHGRYLEDARGLADEAIEKLWHEGLFRGHPAKPYYEAMDGVGYLLYALLELDHALRDTHGVVSSQQILLGSQRVVMPLDNW